MESETESYEEVPSYTLPLICSTVIDSDDNDDNGRSFSLSLVEEYLESRPKQDPFTALAKLKSYKGGNCVMKNEEIRKALLMVSSSVVAVSVFDKKECIYSCSGLVIAWNEEKSEGTILTTARLLKFPEKYCSRKSYNLVVRLKDGTLLNAQEEVLDFYHDLMLLKVMSNQELKAVTLEEEDMTEGMKVVSVGRNFQDCNTKANDGELLLEYPFFGCQELLRTTCNISDVNEGGPLISTSGIVLGINLSYGEGYAFPLPTSVILRSLNKFMSNRVVMRPWLGVDVVDSDLLTISAWEKLGLATSESCVVVMKVHEGSPAYDKGVRPGDFVICCADNDVVSAEQLNRLLDTVPYKWKGRRGIKFAVRRLEDKEIVQIDAELIDVSDRRFSSCWPKDYDLWLQLDPFSQSPPPHTYSWAY